MASSIGTVRKNLSAGGLCEIIRGQFQNIPDTRRQASIDYTLPDTLMAAFAMFQFKCPSLLQFDKASRDTEDETMIGNLKRLYKLGDVPCDSQMRTILDTVSPSSLRSAFRGVHSAVQRGKMLDEFKVMGDKVVVSIDGTGLFSSTAIRCDQCGVKKHKSGTTEYYHQLLAAVIVSPNLKSVLPIDFEPIIKSDGQSKDCSERNAAKRLIPSLASQYPKRQLLIVEDGLAANGPHIQLLNEHGMDYVIGAKVKGNVKLFEAFDHRRHSEQQDQVIEFEQIDSQTGITQGCRFSNSLSLNDSHKDLLVNLMEFWEVDAKGKKTEWSWITNLTITPENALEIAAIGRSRWGIENQTFNTLKNQGYNLEHNYGHGKKYLSSTLAGLMLLAFLCDQVQEYACPLYKAARKKTRIKATLWAHMQSYLLSVDLPDWETLIRLIAKLGPKLVISTAPSTG